MRPSEPFLALLRDLVKKRGLNNAAVAERIGVERQRIRKVLTGTEPMTVDELIMLGEALELSPADMAFPDLSAVTDGGEDEDEDEDGGDDVHDLHGSDDDDSDDGDLHIDPYGNQPEQLFRVAFELGCDFLFLADTAQLEDSGIPTMILRQFADGDVPIRLDAAYHPYNEPRYTDDDITLTLSFDALYDCTFPWSSIRQVTMYPGEPLEESAIDADDEEPAGPALRLVE